MSCDRYSDLWKPFFALWARYWPNCAYPVYFVTNEKRAYFPGVRSIAVGPDASWSTGLRRALLRIPEEYVLLFLDDLLLAEEVPALALDRIIGWATGSRVNCLRLHPDPPPDFRIDRDVGLVNPGGAYRASTVVTLWARSVLIQLLRDGESAWEFEIRGSERADAYGEFYATYRPWIKVTNGVIKGKWRPEVVRWLLREGVAVDLERRAVMSRRERTRCALLDIRHMLFNHLPSRWRRPIKNLLHSNQYGSSLPQ
jgi:hypothetical protein